MADAGVPQAVSLVSLRRLACRVSELQLDLQTARDECHAAKQAAGSALQQKCGRRLAHLVPYKASKAA